MGNIARPSDPGEHPEARQSSGPIEPRTLGVVSDTHGQASFARAAVRMLESLDVDLVLHCGDIGTIEIVELFAPWPTHFVFGNTDWDCDELRQAMRVAGHTCHERFGTLEAGGRKIAFLHGDDSRLFDQTTTSGRYDLVCFGHTHRPEQRVTPRGTLVLNPGALYRANPHTFATVDLASLTATIIPL